MAVSALQAKGLELKRRPAPKGPGSARQFPGTGIQADVEYGLQPFSRGTFSQSGSASIAADIP